ncbi:sugar-binding transcriptional regulator [Inediibacterium massiliense]|uniref:sugar-binding transcriptional regulator n=1 Tax=Inediibacterium massiliense TaxID=1658111 RepID=UPI0006B63B3F|nr:sugar-binding domain-containing protein [Inediibacterium massiliense]
MVNKEEFSAAEFIKTQKKIVPEIIELLMDRYHILRMISYHQPIGRRSLSAFLQMSERVIRKEVNILKEQELIEIKAEGMNITESGYTSLEVLRSFIHIFKNLNSMEEEIVQKLKIKNVIVVPGFYDEDELILREVGKVASNYFKTILKDHVIVGVTGGTTMAMVADEMVKADIKHNVMIVPARGGLGKNAESQANHITAKIAKKLNCPYELLHMPDNISKDLLETLSKDPNTKEVVDYIKKINILLFGIGRADKMAKRRGLSDEEIEDLNKKCAVAEAFGYYFNLEGKIIEEVNTVGVSLETYKELKNPIGVAAGREKAQAIMSISRLNKNLTLIIDEGLAKEILK